MNLVSSKVIHVCDIMTCFTNYDVIDLYKTSCHIFLYQKYIDIYYICAKFGCYCPFVKRFQRRGGAEPTSPPNCYRAPENLSGNRVKLILLLFFMNLCQTKITLNLNAL